MTGKNGRDLPDGESDFATLSDEALARAAQRGCPRSFEELVRRYQVPVLHFVEHRGPAVDAEDVVQDVFIRVFTRLASYNDARRFRTWLFTVARRVWINHLRRRRVEPCPDGDENAISQLPAPEEQAMAAEQQSRLWRIAAETLGELDTAALWLHYVEGMPLKDVAAVLGRSVVSIRVRLHRARKRLFVCLRDDRPVERMAADCRRSV